MGASISALQYHLILGHIGPAKDLWQHESEHSRICEHLCVGLFGLIDLFGMQSAHQSGLGKTHLKIIMQQAEACCCMLPEIFLCASCTSKLNLPC